MIEPMTPAEALKLRNKLIPDFVYSAFNEVLALNINASNGEAAFYQGEVVNRIVASMALLDTYKDLSVNERHRLVRDARWLNVEGEYRLKGWTVTRENGESGAAFFVFKASR